MFDIIKHLCRQRDFSLKTFGPGKRRKGVADHIRKELKEIEADPEGLGECEWIDVIILGFDGALRDGRQPEEIIDLMVAKQTKNEGRVWPDWRLFGEDQAIEHNRTGEMLMPLDTPSPLPHLMGIPALTDDQVEAVLHLVESRLCIIWAKVGAREAFAKELRVMEPAPDDEEEICEACGEAFEEGDLVYWSSDDTGHLHADCCGPEREGYVNPDGSPLADGDPIPQPFAYKPPSKTIKRLATATEGSGDAD